MRLPEPLTVIEVFPVVGMIAAKIRNRGCADCEVLWVSDKEQPIENCWLCGRFGHHVTGSGPGLGLRRRERAEQARLFDPE